MKLRKKAEMRKKVELVVEPAPPPIMWGALYWYEARYGSGTWRGTCFASRDQAWKEHLHNKKNYHHTSFVKYDGTVVEEVGPCE